MKHALLLSLSASALLLAGCGTQSPPAKASGLNSDSPLVRTSTATEIGRSGDAASAPALVKALADPDAGVRREAAKALGLLRHTPAVGPLVAALGDEEMNVRFCAAYALGEIRDPAACGPLLVKLGDPEYHVRDQAAWALREIADPKTVAPLVESLDLPGAEARQTLWILERFDASVMKAPLAKLLQYEKAQTRVRAVEALAKTCGAEAADLLLPALEDKSADVRLVVLEQLRTLDAEGLEDAVKARRAVERDPAVLEALDRAIGELSREEGLAGHWSFEGSGAAPAKDVTGAGTDGQVVRAKPAPGKIGQGMKFSGNGHIAFGQPAALPIANRPFSIVAWAKSEADNGVVVGRGGAFCGYSLYIKDGVAKFGVHRVQDGPGYIAAGSRRVVGAWTHLAGVVREDRIQLYVNGQLAAETKTPGYLPSNCGQGMEIGGDLSNSAAEITDGFVGIIDEVKAYDIALTAEQVAEKAGEAASGGG